MTQLQYYQSLPRYSSALNVLTVEPTAASTPAGPQLLKLPMANNPILKQPLSSVPKAGFWLQLCTYFQISHKDQAGHHYKMSLQYILECRNCFNIFQLHLSLDRCRAGVTREQASPTRNLSRNEGS